MYKLYIKIIFDFVIAFLIMLFLLPLIIIITIMILIQNKENPFFFQERPGKHQKPFKIIKFKTMTDATDEEGNLLPDNIRLTKLGKIIRKFSLDELPQLINVLKGDMSLVGPRPLLFKYIHLYSIE